MKYTRKFQSLETYPIGMLIRQSSYNLILRLVTDNWILICPF